MVADFFAEERRKEEWGSGGVGENIISLDEVFMLVNLLLLRYKHLCIEAIFHGMSSLELLERYKVFTIYIYIYI